METSLSIATASPITRIINGTEYFFSPLRIRALGELEQWMRAKVITVARDSLGDASLNDKHLIMEEAFKNSNLISFLGLGGGFNAATATEAEILARKDRVAASLELMLKSIDTIIKMVHLSLTQKQPRITMAEAEDLLDSPDVDSNALVSDIMRISGLAGNETTGTGGSDPKGLSTPATP
jgi:hypothetical protein